MTMKMKKYLLLAVSLIAAGSLLAQNPPRIQYRKTVINAGAFPLSDRTKEYVFHYKNVGDSALVITRVAATCACVSVDFSRDPLMPGDSTTITARYEAHTPGKFSQMLTVISNSDRKITRLYLQGDVTEAKKENE